MASYQYVFVMKGLTKVYPGGKKVLENIWLSFYPDAKIGVLGRQRLGQVDPAEDHGRHRQGVHRRGQGRRRRQASATWSRSRSSTQAKTVQENVMEALARTKALLDRFDDVSTKLGEVTTPTSAPDRGAGRAAGEDRRRRPLGPPAHVEMAMDALRCPPGDCAVDKLSGGERRRVALCPPAAPEARHAAAGRADQPPGRRERGLAASTTWRTSRAPSSWSPTTATSWTRSTGWTLELDRGQGIPYEGNYSAWLEQKQKRLEQEAKTEAGRQKHAGARAGMGAGRRPRPARPSARRASGAYERCWPRAASSSATRPRSSSRRRARAWAAW